MNAAEPCEMTDAELDAVAGAEPNLGGYSHCVYPHEGLYVGPCQTPPPNLGDLGLALASDLIKAGSAGGKALGSAFGIL